MLFRRRIPASRWERARIAFWPRRSFARSVRYFSRRVVRLTATPHAIAAGVAAGAFASFLPYVGFHFLIALLVAWLVRGSLVASLLATAIGNPLTFPFIWAAGLSVGRGILEGVGPAYAETPQIGELLRQGQLSNLWEPLFLPMTIGGAILGAAFGVVLYAVTLWGVSAFRAQRRARIVQRASNSPGYAAGG